MSRLTLSLETLRTLRGRDLEQVQGGTAGFATQDSCAALTCDSTSLDRSVTRLNNSVYRCEG